ncbi:MAG TPA: PQQ-binding-like beta-propeller repeat protein [Euzebyales bacterium]|nr:PQQ-binding-like beta-propeller repeat protein [Euzebyales bacterium]
METFAGHVLQTFAFRDAVSEVWHGRPVGRPSQRATIRAIALAEGDDLGPAVGDFLEEAWAAAGIAHHNVVRVYDVDGPRRPYVISRYTLAVPLADHLVEGLGTDEALELLGPLASALDIAAAAGIPHGAVNPRTIWVEQVTRSSEPRAMLSGFGLHHLLAVVATRQPDGEVLDDFLYVAPEMLRGALPTNRSDQFSLAAAFHHALTGRPMFERQHLSALFGAQLFTRAPAIHTPGPGDATALADIMARALAKNPDDRFETCQAFVAELRRWQRSAAGPLLVRAGTMSDDRVVTVAPLPRAVASRATHREPIRRRPSSTPKQPPFPHQPLPPLRRRARIAARRRRMMSYASALAVAVVLGGAVAAFGWRQGAPDEDPSVAAEAVRAATVESEAPDRSTRWQQQLGWTPTALHVTDAGLVVTSFDHTMVIDEATGRVRAELQPAGRFGVVAGGDHLVVSRADGMEAFSVEDGTARWKAPIITASPPTAVGSTVYGVSNDAIPQLVATDAQSGERLWAFPEGEQAFPASVTVAAGEDFVYLADDSAIYGILPEGAVAGEDTSMISATEPASEPLCLWRHEVDSEMWRSSLRASDSGVVVASRSGEVCLRDHTDGQPVWCVQVAGVDRASPTLLDAGDRVLVVSREAVVALDVRTGNQVWRHAGDWTRSVVTDDRLVTIDDESMVTSVSLDDGTLTRPVSFTVGAVATLAVDGDTLYAARRDGMLLSVALSAANASRGHDVVGPSAVTRSG